MSRPSKPKPVVAAADATPLPENFAEAIAAPVSPDPAAPQQPETTGAEPALAAADAASVEPLSEDMMAAAAAAQAEAAAAAQAEADAPPETPADWIAPSSYPGSPEWFAQSQRRQRG